MTAPVLHMELALPADTTSNPDTTQRKAADLMAEDAKATTEAVSRRLTDSLQGDLFDYYTRALQAARGVQINAAAIAAANTQIQ